MVWGGIYWIIQIMVIYLQHIIWVVPPFIVLVKYMDLHIKETERLFVISSLLFPPMVSHVCLIKSAKNYSVIPVRGILKQTWMNNKKIPDRFGRG